MGHHMDTAEAYVWRHGGGRPAGPWPDHLEHTCDGAVTSEQVEGRAGALFAAAGRRIRQ